MMHPPKKGKPVTVYTDGSCNPKFKVGGWASLLISEKGEITLQGGEMETTHNRMELLSVIKSLDYITKNFPDHGRILIHSDSQYVVRIPERMEKLERNNFLTRSKKPVKNIDLVKRIIGYTRLLDIEFIKVEAHQKSGKTENYNRTVDRLSRKIVREYTAGGKNEFH